MDIKSNNTYLCEFLSVDRLVTLIGAVAHDALDQSWDVGLGSVIEADRVQPACKNVVGTSYFIAKEPSLVRFERQSSPSKSHVMDSFQILENLG